MKRRGFLQGLAGLAGVSALPKVEAKGNVTETSLGRGVSIDDTLSFAEYKWRQGEIEINGDVSEVLERRREIIESVKRSNALLSREFNR